MTVCISRLRSTLTAVALPGVLAAGLLTGCVDARQVNAAGLRTVDSCSTLLDLFHDRGRQHVGAWGYQSHLTPWSVLRDTLDSPVAVQSEAAADASGAAGSAPQRSNPARPVDTGRDDDLATNNQERGVDEADLVKTDGSTLVVIGERRVHVLDVTTTPPQPVYDLDFEPDEWDGELFLHNDHITLITRTAVDAPEGRTAPDGSGTTTSSRGEVASGSDRDLPFGGPYQPTVPAVRVRHFTVTSPTPLRDVTYHGTYVSARQFGDHVRLVYTSPPPSLPFVYPTQPDAEPVSASVNQDLIATTTIDQWLPHATSGTTTRPVVECNRVHIPADHSGLSLLNIVTFDATTGTSDDSLAVLTDATTVYANPTRMIVATPIIAPDQPPVMPMSTAGDDDTTRERVALHLFNVSSQGRSDHLGSGSLAGRLLNQFSLDEHQGFVRVATTEGHPWSDSGSANYITVLQLDQGQLDIVGRSDPMGLDEQIYATRFTDTTAYLVTFRQTDPFYIVDLTRPDQPEVRGELKIPGFSNYLHPISDRLVIGIGQDADPTGRVTGGQISLFDVSEPTQPRRLDQIDLGADTWPLPGIDHRSFRWSNPHDLGIVPVQQWQGWSSDRGHHAVVITVDNDQLVVVADLQQPRVTSCDRYPTAPRPDIAEPFDGPAISPAPWPQPDEPWCVDDVPLIVRTVIVDDQIHTISTHGVHTIDVTTFEPRHWLTFAR